MSTGQTVRARKISKKVNVSFGEFVGPMERGYFSFKRFNTLKVEIVELT